MKTRATTKREEEENNNILTSTPTVIASKFFYFVSCMNMQHCRASDFVNDVELLDSKNSEKETISIIRLNEYKRGI